MPETPSKPPRLATLDSIARHTRRAQVNASAAWGSPHDMKAAQSFAAKAEEHSTAALTELELLGARIPALQSDEPATESNPVPLHLLDTPASRALLDALETAERAALAVDRERGWLDSDGESVGLAESIAQMAIGLRYDIHGPAGRD